ncbi:mitogen-activated protein kinase kinase 5-like [Setaria viridis]|uniref:mitogen-activated protein kinase kinase 5-like n=1 Tax=Setaria viridis TaxID=4556 RepID=UPI00149329CC|nr:mitogen-activated protein kinase kinase 5-like [Setaria viridis]
MYLSPERFKPDTREDVADVWGFGVTILELFLGRCSFLAPGGLPFEKLRLAICDREPPLVLESPTAAAELLGFVITCLQKDLRRFTLFSSMASTPRSSLPPESTSID